MNDFTKLLEVVGKRTALSTFLPGLILAWLTLGFIWESLSEPSIRGKLIIPESETALWIAFFILGWILGALLKLIGSLLDKPVYDWFFKKIVKKGQNELLGQAKKTIHTDLGEGIDWDNFDYFNYSLTYVKTENIEHGIKEIDEYIGNSKFFRSLAVSMFGIGCALALVGLCKYVTPSFIFSLVSLWAFCVERWNSTQRTYEYYITARNKKGHVAHKNENP